MGQSLCPESRGFIDPTLQISLSGTIPVPFKGSSYNIPVALWILDTHPLHAPMAFVRPTADMQIRVSKHVDQNGRVYLPYLHEWSEANSDILGLIQVRQENEVLQ